MGGLLWRNRVDAGDGSVKKAISVPQVPPSAKMSSWSSEASCHLGWIIKAYFDVQIPSCQAGKHEMQYLASQCRCIQSYKRYIKQNSSSIVKEEEYMASLSSSIAARRHEGMRLGIPRSPAAPRSVTKATPGI